MLFKNFTYSFGPEERVGVIGPNGSGKSTLLDLIARRRFPVEGKLRLGTTVSLGYLDQKTNDLINGKGLERKVIDFVEEVASFIDLGKKQITSSQLLEKFLFPPSQQHSPLRKLSGGEKRRLTLCRILIQAPNVLLLDEPTNDLDVQTLSVLEDFLEDFQGCVVVVSHDRYFLDRTVDRIFSFEEDCIKKYEGNYSDFLKRKQLIEEKINKELEAKKQLSNHSAKIEKKNLKFSSSKTTSSKRDTTNSKHRKRSFKESKEIEKIEQDLPLLEAKKTTLEKEMVQSNKDLTGLSQQLADIIEQINYAEDRWIEISELDE